ncbi:methyltransferase [Lysinibacillus contaminans]|uniref:Methyltransferase n=1 Tax=Lysinibacillus contaminans TaxID=1293441 RepID=A0ABR5K196_9BACI|nr:O-methyltransferase [Lysinibacillus contaminans]KOS68661.1 methyltransferase [Lysinibacillus contaminans]
MQKLNNYIDELFDQEDLLLEGVLHSIRDHGMPTFSVSPSSGKLLTMLVSIAKAKNVLEIGALGGYSGICLARGFGEIGTLTSLELEESYATLAKENVTKAGFGEQVSYMIGPAIDNLQKLVVQGKTFDFFFIDADKGSYESYLDYCIQLAVPGALIVSDNVLADGTVVDDTMKPKRYTEIMKQYNAIVAKHPRLDSMLLPLGDGMTVSKVK